MSSLLKSRSAHVWLVALALVSGCAYAAIAYSGQSLHEEGPGGHSLLTILGLFTVCFACYLAAVGVITRSTTNGASLAIIIGSALLFRALLLFADPIEEIDIYRYLWDGAASTNGVNPFRYAPQQVLAAEVGDALPDDLARLVALRDRSSALAEILARVHFGELPTIYPPVSQVVFALATAMTPDRASVRTRMTIMKAWFVGFDLLTIVVVLKMLRLCGQPDASVVVYAWCPLVIKEIANSGHLDSLAVFLTALACYVVCQMLFAAGAVPLSAGAYRPSLRRGASLAAFLLALAIGSKLYPLVLAPLLLFAIAIGGRWRDAVSAAFVFLATTALLLSPMWPGRTGASWKPPASVEQTGADLAPLPPEEVDLSPRDPSQSLRAFLTHWEMNDFLFLLVMENVRPMANVAPHEQVWFSIVPESWRVALLNQLVKVGSLDADVAAFVFTRGVTSLFFMILAGTFAYRAARSSTPGELFQYAFLTIAWFWLLLPTSNPWYWTWALPFLPFARSRIWVAMSGLAMLYYLRFWLVYNFPDTPILGTPYSGRWFFDYVVTWLEFAPWFVALACGQRQKERKPSLTRS